MKISPVKIIVILCILLHIAAYGGKNSSSWDGSRSIPVHLLPLMDENNQPIIPGEPYPLPYSTRYTCGPCHDYETILSGLHFNEGSVQPAAGKPGEPWFWVDTGSGTILPVSSRPWPGTWNLAQSGLTPWSFTLLFGRHQAGGGFAEPQDRYLDRESRWNVSGVLEVNCMGCHNASRLQSHSEWARQVLRQNFRWAAAAASSLGQVGGMASRLPGTWDIYDGINPDDSVYAIVPTIVYDQNRFDGKHRVFFDILHVPEDARCLTCHSTARVGEERFAIDGDIHSVSKIKCADCHRNSLNHKMIRGYEGEFPGQENDFSCRGCHVGKTKGRLGAPYPLHKGLPAVHFTRLSCTVCHSGPLLAGTPVRVRTSRANRLGIYGIAQWYSDAPHIVEPIFKKGSDGKIAPFRLTWPSFWAKLEGDRVTPLQPEIILESGQGILNAEEQVAKILAALSTNPERAGEPVLAASGKVFRSNVDGLLDVSPFKGDTAAGMLWLLKTGDKTTPLIPDFDTDSEQPDADVENIITETLELLSTLEELPGKPALIYKDKLYRITMGYLEAIKSPGEAVNIPQLCCESEGKPVPLISPFVLRTVLATAGSENSLTEEQVTLVLKKLLKNGPEQGSSEFAYISGGKLFTLAADGSLVSREHAAAEPVTWPLAHDVRPARLALGVNGCRDCHTASSSFFFTEVKGTGPLKTEHAAVKPMHRFMGQDKYYEKLFGLSFTFRPVLKIILFISIFFISLVLVNKLRESFKSVAGKLKTIGEPYLEQWAFLLFRLTIIFLSLTGFFFALFINRGLFGLFLLLHVAAGGIFAVTLTILVFFRSAAFFPLESRKKFLKKQPARENIISINRIQASAVWIIVLSGLFQVVSALILMMPLFSTEVNLDIAALHSWAGLITLLAAMVYGYYSAAGSGRKK